ncbi:MAG: hypothetical protein ABIH83_05765 [Candidatus Micrarchaeota archaeon]
MQKTQNTMQNSKASKKQKIKIYKPQDFSWLVPRGSSIPRDSIFFGLAKGLVVWEIIKENPHIPSFCLIDKNEWRDMEVKKTKINKMKKDLEKIAKESIESGKLSGKSEIETVEWITSEKQAVECILSGKVKEDETKRILIGKVKSWIRLRQVEKAGVLEDGKAKTELKKMLDIIDAKTGSKPEGLQ